MPAYSTWLRPYGYGLAKNHCFIDGNKRIALAAIALFLRKNGCQLVAPEAEVVETILRLAEGAMDQEQLAAWIAENSQQL
jgi:death-on-curing protein